MQVAGWVAAILLAAVAVFQVALALGAPWGAHAYGGRAAEPDGRLPGRYRLMSAVAVPVLVGAAWILATTATSSSPSSWMRTAVWIIFGYLVLNTLANVASRSTIERFGLGAVSAGASVASLVVAIGS